MKQRLLPLVLFLTLRLSAADWPQFLGPNRDGTIADETVAQAWLKHGLQEQWRQPIGEGYSGIAASGNQIFTMDRKGDDEFIVAMQSNDGKEIWRTRTGSS